MACWPVQVAGELTRHSVQLTMVNSSGTLLALASRQEAFVVPLPGGGSGGQQRERAGGNEAGAAAGAAGQQEALAVRVWPPAGWSHHPGNSISALQWSPDGRKLLLLLDNWQPFPEVGSLGWAVPVRLMACSCCCVCSRNICLLERLLQWLLHNAGTLYIATCRAWLLLRRCAPGSGL
jgi:hypothetical protein